MKVGQLIKVKRTGQILRITRIDKHAYPICAGYCRFKPDDIEMDLE